MDGASRAPGCSHTRTLEGRGSEILALQRALDEAVEGRGSVVLVTGEPGIGKTALAGHALAVARDRGFRVLAGSGHPLLAELALAPVTEALEGSSPTAPLLDPRAWAESGPLAPSAAIHALRSAIVPSKGDPPVALFLDDAEHLDALSLALVHSLSRRAPRVPMLLLLACGLDGGRAIRAIDTGAPVLRLSLDRLPDDAVLRILHPAPPHGSDSSAGRVADHDREALDRAAGLPLYAVALSDGAPDAGHADGPARLPVPVRDLIDRERGQLGSRASTVLDVLALAHRPLDLATMAAASGWDRERAGAAVEALLRRGPARACPDLPADRYVVAHPMYREHLMERPPFVRAGLHARLAGALERAGERAAAAEHYLLAGPEVGGAGYAAAAIAAAEHAQHDGGPGDVVRYLRPLTEVPIPGLDRARLAEALEALGTAHARLGDAFSADGAWQRALTLAEECDDADRAASVRYRLMMASMQAVDVERVARELTPEDPGDPGVSDTLPVIPPTSQSTSSTVEKLERDLAALVWAGRFGDMRHLRAAAAQVVRAAGGDDDPRGRGVEALGLTVLRVLDGDIGDARRQATRAVAELEDSGWAAGAMSATRMLARVAVLGGDLPTSLRLSREYLDLVLRDGGPSEECIARTWLGFVHYLRGDLDEAQDQATTADTVAAASRSMRSRVAAGLLSALIAAERGRTGRAHAGLAEAERLYRGGLDRDRGLGSFAALVRSTLALRAGEPGRVADPDLGVLDSFLFLFCLRSVHAGIAGAMGHDPTRADRQARFLRSRGPDSPVLDAFADRLSGLSAASAGRSEEAVGLLRESARRLDELGFRLHAAQTHVEAAECAAEGEPAVALADVERALAVFEAQGVSWWTDRARRLARALGRHPARRRGPGDPPLTARESEIARLVAIGLSNAAIAGRLFLSERTVETHLRHIYAALGATSRIEIARWAEGDHSVGTPG
ncbi:helix-turn-helix transcriptional regulator [Planctomonas deserti]|uniref:helix-turn-helix transcriptional regulator n=1 Tax=Planctomonas deserti TaxID=2144185 RepID=UPI000D3BE9A2|nr:LuxR family transcriptional regulator [Planctomonas deserti]